MFFFLPISPFVDRFSFWWWWVDFDGWWDCENLVCLSSVARKRRTLFAATAYHFCLFLTPINVEMCVRKKHEHSVQVFMLVLFRFQKVSERQITKQTKKTPISNTHKGYFTFSTKRRVWEETAEIHHRPSLIYFVLDIRHSHCLLSFIDLDK